MPVTFADHLIMLQALDKSPVIPTPPAYAQVWQHGLDDGLPLGTLWVLKAPLAHRAGGVYERNTGNIWVYHSDEEPELGLRFLLHELAHAYRRSPIATTIEEDWDEEIATYRCAAWLASRWRLEQIVPALWLNERLDEIEVLREHHQQAGRLVGSHHPRVARAAYSALVNVADTHAWDDETFEAALFGYHEDDNINALAVDLDRCQLRGWSLPWRQSAGFEALTLPQDTRTAQLLRSTLEEVLQHGTRLEWRVLDTEYLQQVAAVDVFGAHALVDAVALCNTALLQHLSGYAYTYWHVYGTPTDPQRLYRLSISYKPEFGDARQQDQSRQHAEVWMLCAPQRTRDAEREAVLQRYIHSWQGCTELRAESLADGLRTLMGQLARVRQH